MQFFTLAKLAVVVTYVGATVASPAAHEARQLSCLAQACTPAIGCCAGAACTSVSALGISILGVSIVYAPQPPATSSAPAARTAALMSPELPSLASLFLAKTLGLAFLRSSEGA
ncbi:hypothetical protein GLOTRDRAFT_133253 [Gloeophyllum trabeum ATCC 11539]|uniref:Hydrophobin n=1 Tax=Gloeophyllum trabeum (strain ATCC 11539 / FP-39264 / Madison 617) TaxID=670483 RepID=S7PVH1_GLOTA|nr:uncharacterized protein GLOTRDRAFT_133253 [Gloeophyllum trabeum ATCC 11539]EPQ51392.1 hypothetical protein GLOTRDRAFT_133253 [Gloeophyllum trabeum ATCC 11539]